MDLGLRGKVVAVTGGASGIGRATAHAFVQEGARVTVLDRDSDALARLAEELDGISRGLDWLHDVAESDWDAVLSVNLKGVWLCMRAELRHMYAQGSGVIVNTASAAGLVGTPGVAHYTASKWGVLGLTKSAALEYAPLGIRINAVAPGTVDTPMGKGFAIERRADPFADALVRQPHPLQGIARPEQVADAILYLAGDRSSFATGSTLVLDGGFSAQ